MRARQVVLQSPVELSLYFGPPTITNAQEVLKKSRCRETMEAGYNFGESAPIERPSGHFAHRAISRPKHGRQTAE